MISIKKTCIQLLCLVPKNICNLWRTQIIRKCIREESNEEIKQCAIHYLPYLIYFLGVSSNSLVFQLILPGLKEEKSLEVILEYGNLLNKLCCLISRKSIIVRKSSFIKHISLLNNDSNTKYNESSNYEMSDYFELLCTCCDKKTIESRIINKITKRKNLELLQTLFNRPKYVDTQILMQFVNILNRYKIIYFPHNTFE